MWTLDTKIQSEGGQIYNKKQIQRWWNIKFVHVPKNG